MLPWLLGHLESIVGYVEPATVCIWQQQDLQNRRKLLINTSWTIRLCSAMQRANIPCLPIKGVCAAMRYYGCIQGRACGDSDLMVLEADLESARRVLLGLGLKAKFPARALNRAEARWVTRSMHHITFTEPESGLLIELHWALHDNALLEREDRKWPMLASETILIGEHRLPALDKPRDYLLLLTHAARSGWAKLKWLLDVWQAWTLLSVDDRAQVECRLRTLRLEPAQRIFIGLASFLFGMAAHEHALHIPAELRLMFDPNDRRSLTRKYRHLQNLYRLRNDTAYRLDTARLHLLNWSDMRVLRLPSWAFAFYFPLRVPMLIYRHLSMRRVD